MELSDHQQNQTDGRVTCSKCGADLTDIHSDTGARLPCRYCGAEERTFHKTIEESVTISSTLDIKHTRPGVRKPLLEVLGWGLRRGRDGVLVLKERLIDRRRYRYRERVETPDGQVIVDKDEDLRKHR